MEKDATSAGVRLGGIFSTAEIKILICYILNAINEPVPVNMLANVLHYEGIANGFEVSDAVVSLQKSGHIKQFDSKDDTYVITESGRDISKTLRTSLSFTVKNRAYAAAVKMQSRFKNLKDTKFEITKENNTTYITCSCMDNERPFMSVKLLVTDDAQALAIKEKFLEDPAGVYAGVIEMLTK